MPTRYTGQRILPPQCRLPIDLGGIRANQTLPQFPFLFRRFVSLEHLLLYQEVSAACKEQESQQRIKRMGDFMLCRRQSGVQSIDLLLLVAVHDHQVS